MMVGGRVVVTVVSDGHGVIFNGWILGLNGFTFKNPMCSEI